MLGKDTIEAIIIDSDDNESANLALIENMQREDLSAIEEALAIEKIMKTNHITQFEIAKKLGYKQSTIANKLRLLKLPDYMILKNLLLKKEALHIHDDLLNQVFRLFPKN